MSHECAASDASNLTEVASRPLRRLADSRSDVAGPRRAGWIPVPPPTAGPGGPLGLTEGEFEKLVEPHLPIILRIARRAMRSEDQAWDAVQESVLCLWRMAACPPEPRPWLVRTVRNRCLHLKRTTRRRHQYEDLAATVPSGPTTSECPEHWLENRRLSALLTQAMAALPLDQRTVFVLRELEGIGYRAIAQFLHIPVGTVRSRLHRGRRALQAQLAGEVGPATGKAAHLGTPGEHLHGNQGSCVRIRARTHPEPGRGARAEPDGRRAPERRGDAT